MHYLEIGGAESALIGLLHALDPERVEVDLFLHSRRGELLRFVPAWVRVLPEIRSYAAIESSIREALLRGSIHVAVARLIAGMRFKHYERRTKPRDWSALFAYVGRCVTPVLPSLRRFGRYDLAVSFLAPHDYVLRKVDAAHRACWIHTDYSHIDVNTSLELPVWSGYDSIVSISPDVTRTFCERFPSLGGKIVEIENIAPEEIIRSRAAVPRPADMPSTLGRMQLLTIGRYSPLKRLGAIPRLCRLLSGHGIDADWSIIGYGGSDAYIREAIAREGMEGRVHLLGKQDNPYPYIAAADCYVQPSACEGKSVAVREAQMLGRPVIVTDFATAASQVADGTDGVIVPMDTEACATAMARVLADKVLLSRLSEACAARDYTNRSEVEKFYRLMEA